MRLGFRKESDLNQTLNQPSVNTLSASSARCMRTSRAHMADVSPMHSLIALSTVVKRCHGRTHAAVTASMGSTCLIANLFIYTKTRYAPPILILLLSLSKAVSSATRDPKQTADRPDLKVFSGVAKADLELGYPPSLCILSLCSFPPVLASTELAQLRAHSQQATMLQRT